MTTINRNQHLQLMQLPIGREHASKITHAANDPREDLAWVFFWWLLV